MQCHQPLMIYVGANDGILHGFLAKTGEVVFLPVPMKCIQIYQH